MNLMLKVAGRLLLLLFCVLFAERTLYAYLDPGSGSMMLQLILGGFAGLGVILKLSWHRIRGFFVRTKDDKHS
jgi:hypothetical protein